MFGFISYWKLCKRIKKERTFLETKREAWVRGEISTKEYQDYFDVCIAFARREIARMRIDGGSWDESQKIVSFLNLLQANLGEAKASLGRENNGEFVSRDSKSSGLYKLLQSL